MKRPALAFALLLSLCTCCFAEEGWGDLFDGKTLDGWEVRSGRATYKVEDGTIVGTTVQNSPNTFLCTKKDYADFILEFEVKCDPELNSGVQFRSHAYEKNVVTNETRNGKPVVKRWPAGRVYGYQVEICKAELGVAGGVWDEARHGRWLGKPEEGSPASKAFKDNEWNKYRVECRGDSIKTFVNGVKCADFIDDKDASGFIGLQVHAIWVKDEFQVRWRNIRIKELNADAKEK